MTKELQPSDYKNELEYVEAVLGFKLKINRYRLNRKKRFVRLDLRGRRLSDINFLRNLTSLIELNLSNIQLSDINVLSNLTSLTSLHLSNTQLSDINVLSNLTSLIKLNLSRNQLNDINVLSKLTSLNTLDLSSTQLNDINVLSKLTSLTSLHLSNTQLNDINVLSKLTSLTSLHLSNTQLNDINFLRNLTSLIELNLSRNQLRDINVLSKLTSLNRLNLSDTQLNDINVLSNLTSLNTLYLSDNQLNDINVLSKLTSLTRLNLSNTELNDINFLRNLTSLIDLDLSQNQLRNINVLSSLTSLDDLSLENNQLKDISALSNLTSLVWLDLENNQLKDISALSNLTSLRWLDIKGNQLDDINILSNLTSLTFLDVSQNPIKNIPETILNSSAQEIVRWFQENEKKGGKVFLKDVKVLLLGNTNIGKSNLLSYWQQWYVENEIKDEYPKKSDSTHGLVYEELQKDKNAPLLHIWDFGGQEYFHATHQLFFSPDALHILLWSKGELNTRINDEEVFELDYWLRCSEQLSKDESPIEMVLIENRIDYKDENDKLEFYSHFPDATYVEKFNIYSPHEETDSTKPPFMLNTCSVSLLHQKRLHGMFELLEERIDMLYQKNLHPSKYAEIRDGLEESTKKVWTLTAYKKKFEQKDGIILQTLHRLGCLLYFHEQLPNKIFTQPKLLLDLIYDDILNEDLQNNKGKLTNELEVAAKNKDLKLKVSELETLLSSFKLIFKTKDDCWYAPQYLPEEAPAWLDLLKQHTFGFPNIIVSSDQYLMNSILLDIFQEYGNIIKKDASYLFWQKGLVIEKDGQLLLIEYDRKQMRLLIYGDQQENNKKLQEEVIEFILETIYIAEGVLYTKESEDYNIETVAKRVYKLKTSVNPTKSGKLSWSSDKVKIDVSIDGKYYVNIQQLNKNVANEIFSIKAFDYDDNTIQKTFSVFRFNQYLDNKHQGTMKKVAISYSKDDLKLVNEFKKSLIPLQDDGLIASPIWYCTDLKAGTEWDNEIKENFEAADMIFFMVSPNFLATNYIKEHEIKTAIEKRTKQIAANKPTSEQLKIIPIILDHCSWTRKDKTMNLGQYNALPYTAKPVMDFDNRNKAWFLTTDSIRIAIENDNDPNFSLESSKEIQKLRERLIEGYLDKNSKI